MDGVNVTDVGTLAGLRGIGGYGYGNGHGNFPGDGSAVKEGVRGNRDIQLLESVNGNAQNSSLANQIRQHNDSIQKDISVGNNFITDRINAQGIDAKFTNVTSQFANVTAQLASVERTAIAIAADAERLAFSNQATTIAQLHAMDLKQTECCCELKAGQAAINAKLDTQGAVSAAVAAARTEARLEALIAGNSGHGNGHGGS